MMNSNFVFVKLSMFLMLVVLFGQPTFCQRKLGLKFVDATELIYTNYSEHDLSKFFIHNDKIYYIRKNENQLEFNCIDLNSNRYQKICEVEIDKPRVYYVSAEIDFDRGKIYLLFDFGVLEFDFLSGQRFKISDMIEIFEQPKQNKFYSMKLTNNFLVLGECYNRATLSTIAPDCEFLILDLERPDLSYEKNIAVDAIGFSHLPNYFHDVKFGKLMITNSLSQKVTLFNLETQETEIICDDGLLTKDLWKIPFNTVINPNSTNARALVSEISQYAKTVDRIEGCFFISSDKIGIVKKLKGESMYSQRVIFVYERNRENKSWKIKKELSFQNKGYSGRYRMFNFHLSNGFKVDEDKFYMPEFSLKRVPKSKGIAYLQALKSMKKKNVTYSIYRFNHDLVN
jgi:hypothetical protein